MFAKYIQKKNYQKIAYVDFLKNVPNPMFSSVDVIEQSFHTWKWGKETIILLVEKTIA